MFFFYCSFISSSSVNIHITFYILMLFPFPQLCHYALLYVSLLLTFLRSYSISNMSGRNSLFSSESSWPSKNLSLTRSSLCRTNCNNSLKNRRDKRLQFMSCRYDAGGETNTEMQPNGIFTIFYIAFWTV